MRYIPVRTRTNGFCIASSTQTSLTRKEAQQKDASGVKPEMPRKTQINLEDIFPPSCNSSAGFRVTKKTRKRVIEREILGVGDVSPHRGKKSPPPPAGRTGGRRVSTCSPLRHEPTSRVRVCWKNHQLSTNGTELCEETNYSEGILHTINGWLLCWNPPRRALCCFRLGAAASGAQDRPKTNKARSGFRRVTVVRRSCSFIKSSLLLTQPQRSRYESTAQDQFEAFVSVQQDSGQNGRSTRLARTSNLVEYRDRSPFQCHQTGRKRSRPHRTLEHLEFFAELKMISTSCFHNRLNSFCLVFAKTNLNQACVCFSFVFPCEYRRLQGPDEYLNADSK